MLTSEVELPKTPDDTISGMFLDPTGRHLIVSMTSGDSHYVARAAQKSKLLNKLKVNMSIIFALENQEMCCFCC